MLLRGKFRALGLHGLAGSPPEPLPSATLTAAQPTEPALPVKPIEDVQLGQRLEGRNPLREEVDQNLPEPDPQTWRAIKLQMVKAGGKLAKMEFLWPPGAGGSTLDT